MKISKFQVLSVLLSIVLVSSIVPNSFALADSSVSTKSEVPYWLKNNAGWWAEGKISEGEFLNAVEYLISENIIKLSNTKLTNNSSDKIPTWVKSNARLWSDGQITDSDFIKGIEQLVNEGLIRVEDENSHSDKTVSAIISAETGATIQSSDGKLTLEFPAGAVSEEVKVSVKIISYEDFLLDIEGMDPDAGKVGDPEEPGKKDGQDKESEDDGVGGGTEEEDDGIGGGTGDNTDDEVPFDITFIDENPTHDVNVVFQADVYVYNNLNEKQTATVTYVIDRFGIVRFADDQDHRSAVLHFEPNEEKTLTVNFVCKYQGSDNEIGAGLTSRDGFVIKPDIEKIDCVAPNQDKTSMTKSDEDEIPKGFPIIYGGTTQMTESGEDEIPKGFPIIYGETIQMVESVELPWGLDITASDPYVANWEDDEDLELERIPVGIEPRDLIIIPDDPEEVDKELKIIPADEESNLEITPTLPEPGESLQNPTITKLKPVTIPVITPISVIP